MTRVRAWYPSADGLVYVVTSEPGIVTVRYARHVTGTIAPTLFGRRKRPREVALEVYAANQGVPR